MSEINLELHIKAYRLNKPIAEPAIIPMQINLNLTVEVYNFPFIRHRENRGWLLGTGHAAIATFPPFPRFGALLFIFLSVPA